MQRGCCSDQPIGVEHYTAARIAGDINALITHVGAQRATIMAFDVMDRVAARRHAPPAYPRAR